MQMYINIMQALNNNQKSAKDQAILLKRFLLTVDKTVGPQLQAI